MSLEPIVTYAQLETSLRNWTSFAAGTGPGEYDVNGMMALFEACVANMRCHFIAEDVQDLANTLTSEDKSFLSRLLNTSDRVSDDPPRSEPESQSRG